MASRRRDTFSKQFEARVGGNDGLRPAYYYSICGPDAGMGETVGPAHNRLDHVPGVGPQDLEGEGPDVHGLEITFKPPGPAKQERYVAGRPRREPKLGG